VWNGRRRGIAIGTGLTVGLGVLLAAAGQHWAARAAGSAAQSAQDAPAEPAGEAMRPSVSRPARLGPVRRVDPRTLAPSTPAAPQEAPLPHAPKAPSGDPGRDADSVFRAPDPAGAAPAETPPTGSP
jgi:hypothetical protein